MSDLPKILFVDDEEHLLNGIKRTLYRYFNIHTATSAALAMQAIQSAGPFVVIVSDMQMPGVDGIRFLAMAKEKDPESIKVMLTGNADMETAIQAVNKGNIFRFLCKPCEPEVLRLVLETCVRQYELQRAEKVLLEKTLKGTIRVLADILAVTNPAAFSRAERIRRYIGQVSRFLQLPNAWRFEIAAMLSHLGYVTIPSQTLEKMLVGEEMTSVEQAMLAAVPQLTGSMIEKIPRLESIAQMITLSPHGMTYPAGTSQEIILGAQLLRLVIDFDCLLLTGSPPAKAIEEIKLANQHHPDLMESLKHIDVQALEKTIRFVDVESLRDGSVLAEEIRDKHGVLVIAKGQEINEVLRYRLCNYNTQRSIAPKVRVYVYSAIGSGE